MQSSSCVSPDYMAQQIEINHKMRAILIDWLIEVYLHFYQVGEMRHKWSVPRGRRDTNGLLLNSKQVHDKFELMEETLFLTVNIIDRFLAQQTVERKKLQLVGLVAMLLACKYEEVCVPVIADLIIISDKTYTRKEFIEMVHHVSIITIPPLSIEGNIMKPFWCIQSAGEIDAQQVAVQHVCPNALCIHEEVPQGCSIRQEDGAVIILPGGTFSGGV